MSCHKKEKDEASRIRSTNQSEQFVKLECQNGCDRCQNKQAEDKQSAVIKKAIALPSSLLLFSLPAWAQNAAPVMKTFWDDPFHHPLLPIYLISFVVFVVLFLTLAVMILVLKVLRVFVEKAALENAAKMGIPYVVPRSWWQKFWQNANALIPLEEEKNIELDHSYDGIRELDNHLPPWWKGLFYGSMVFAVVYLTAFHVVNSLPSSQQEYENEIAIAQEQARALLASQPAAVIDEAALKFTNDAALISRGKAIFVSSNCASCHRNDGAGNNIGPNLTDEYWLHGGDIGHVFSTIKNGVVEKAMPAWGKVMSQKDVRDVAFYVMSLHGTNPPNAKAPQGELYKPKPDSIARDSTKFRASIKAK